MVISDFLNWSAAFWPDLLAQSTALLRLLFKLSLTAAGAYFLYVVFFRILRLTFRKFERDIALVTLNVSAYPALSVFIFVCIEASLRGLGPSPAIAFLSTLFLAFIILATSYWVYQLVTQVLVYYLKDYAATTEAMWDNVLIPLLEGVIPLAIGATTLASILQFCLGIDLSAVWLTLGGAGVILGFATKDILANFFSGLALLIDSPFQFGDVLRFEDASGNANSLGILKKIGLRVTHLYMFETHTEVYIPNSVLQSQQIRNLSRPIEPIYHSQCIDLRATGDLEYAIGIMHDVIQAHPNTLGNIDDKLACLEQFFHWDDRGWAAKFTHKKQCAQARLIAEQQVNQKLEEVEHLLEALVLTIQFAESGGVNAEELDNIRTEYRSVLDLLGFEVQHNTDEAKQHFRLPWLKLTPATAPVSLVETSTSDSLVQLIRSWYRAGLLEPDVVDGDQYVLPEIWESKIALLRRRVTRLYRTLLYPQRQETRLDDSVHELQRWLRERFKQARSTWQEPKVSLERVVMTNDLPYVRFRLNYYVDDIRLEDGERGLRVNSDIHREILYHLKNDYVVKRRGDWNGKSVGLLSDGGDGD